MRVSSVQSNVAFGYSHPLKTLFLKGKFPTVKYGLYGDLLTKDNVSLEHLLPRSKGGKSVLENYALASKRNNQLRGNDDISKYLTKENLEQYINQWVGIKLKNFDGNKYIAGFLKTINELLNK